MANTPQVSLGLGLACATLTYGIFQGAMPTQADVRSLDAHNDDIYASEKMAAWTAGAAVAGISLLAKDYTVFVIGGSMVIAMSWWYKHANNVDPASGRAQSAGPSVSDATPAITQDEAPQLYSVPVTGMYDAAI